MFGQDLERRELRHLEDPAKDVNFVGVCVSQQRMEQACGSVSLTTLLSCCVIVSGSVSGAPCRVRRKVEQIHAPRVWVSVPRVWYSSSVQV